MKTILFTTFLLFSVNVFAQNWVQVSKNIEGDVFYVDTDNVKTHNGFVYYWELSDFLEPYKGASSIIAKYKVDCAEEKTKRLTTLAYSQAMGKGREISEERGDSNDFYYPKPNTVGYHTMHRVCTVELFRKK